MARRGSREQRPLRQKVARRLRARRAALGLSQEDLAQRAGISRSYYAAIEAGSRNMSLDVLDDLARALGARVSELVADEAEVERLDDPHAVRFAQLLGVLDAPTRRTVLAVMERFADYARDDGPPGSGDAGAQRR